MVCKSNTTIICLCVQPVWAILDDLTIIFLTTIGRASRIRLSLLLVERIRVAAKLFLRSETVLASLGIDFRIAQERELLGCLHVSHLLDEALGEDDIDLFQ